MKILMRSVRTSNLTKAGGIIFYLFIQRQLGALTKHQDLGQVLGWGTRKIETYRMQTGLHSFRKFRGESIPYLFQLLEAACIPWLVTPFHPQTQPSHCSKISTSLTLTPPLPLLLIGIFTLYGTHLDHPG